MSSSVLRLSSLFRSKSTPVTNPLFKTLSKSKPVSKSKSTPTPSPSLKPRIQSFVKEPVTTTSLSKSTPVTPTPLFPPFLSELEYRVPNFRDLDKTIYLGFKREVLDLINFHLINHDDAILEKTIYRLLEAKEYTLIHDLIEFQKKDPHLSRECCLVTMLMYEYGTTRKLDEAQKLFDAMPERTIGSSHILINAYVQNKQFDKALRVFLEMQIPPNGLIYDVVIHALCEKGDLDSAEKMLHQMESNGFTPNVHIFNRLTRGFYSVQGKFDDGERVWTKMEKMGIKPNVVGYEGKLQGLLNEGKVSEAGKIFEELKKRDLEPSVETYNILLIWYCKAGLLDEAKGVYDRLKESGNVPGRFTYEAIIPCCIDLGEESFNKCSVDPAILQSVVDLLRK